MENFSFNLGITAILGYFMLSFKNLPKIIFNLFKTNICSSISVTSKNRNQYRKINKYILSLNKKSLNNNLENCEGYKNGSCDEFKTINYGTYLIKINTFSFMLIEKTMKENNYDISSVIDITIFGLHRNKILKNIMEKLEEKDNNYIKVFCSLNFYDYGMYIPKKNFDNIYINNKKELINKIDKWGKNKELYINNGIIHKLGILLYGEPGTGKSSTARAIATYTNRPLYVINLKGYDNSEKLMDKLLSIKEKSIVLFEDVDCFIGDRNKIDGNKEEDILNMALNFLDGVYSPNDCIIIATTNHIEKLDKAFIRDGRFDIKMKIDKMNCKLAKEMCDNFGIDIKDLDIDYNNINPSSLQNKIINYINNINY